MPLGVGSPWRLFVHIYQPVPGGQYHTWVPLCHSPSCPLHRVHLQQLLYPGACKYEQSPFSVPLGHLELERADPVSSACGRLTLCHLCPLQTPGRPAGCWTSTCPPEPVRVVVPGPCSRSSVPHRRADQLSCLKGDRQQRYWPTSNRTPGQPGLAGLNSRCP